jgi:hypothetical protein
MMFIKKPAVETAGANDCLPYEKCEKCCIFEFSTEARNKAKQDIG